MCEECLFFSSHIGFCFCCFFLLAGGVGLLTRIQWWSEQILEKNQTHYTKNQSKRQSKLSQTQDETCHAVATPQTVWTKYETKPSDRSSLVFVFARCFRFLVHMYTIFSYNLALLVLNQTMQHRSHSFSHWFRYVQVGGREDSTFLSFSLIDPSLLQGK